VHVVINANVDVLSVRVLQQEGSTATTTSTTKEPPNPILPVPAEMAWGLGSFLVLVLLMRVWLYPGLKKGIDARNAKVRADHESAEATRDAAARDLAQYEAAIATARGEAAGVIDAARQDVDEDRRTKIAAANARIADQRSVAAAEIEAARHAALGQVEDIVVEVASAAAEKIVGAPIDRASARPLVSEVVRAGVGA
jgi:F-type H+-transporting ATPase subunit b